GATEQSNCHGWIFTAGKFNIPGDEVELILKENGYQPISDPHPSDLVVYRTRQGVAHTAIVRSVTEGHPVFVERKWGNLGLFLHPVDKSVYGPGYPFYRSHRLGHLLAGMCGTAPAVQHSTSE